MAKRVQIAGALQATAKQLKRSGVDYADLRWVYVTEESIEVEDGAVEHLSSSISEGIAIRALIHGAWGYACSSVVTAKGTLQTARRALEMAKGAAQFASTKVAFPEHPPQRGSYRTPLEIDPFTVPLNKKLDYLMWANRVLGDHASIRTASATMDFYRTEKVFVSTEGSLIHQEITESGAALEAVAELGGEIQSRSYPISNDGSLAQAGYEYVKQLDLVGNAERIRKEVVSLLRAPECPSGIQDLILMPDQLVLQLHESCGHPIELDRVLGSEVSFAGGSFLDPGKLGKFQYGSKLVNITADATCPMGVGTFGYDDEGVPAQTYPVVRDGIFVEYLSSRESAADVGLSSTGAMRADAWSATPLVRMTNINLTPGVGTLKDLIQSTRRGILMATNKSWSIDDMRLNFQFGCEIAWEIRNGKIGQVYKNPVYTGITPKFWGSMDAVTAESEWKLFGLPNCGKGEPVQTMHTGHGASPARFKRVQIGSKR